MTFTNNKRKNSDSSNTSTTTGEHSKKMLKPENKLGKMKRQSLASLLMMLKFFQIYVIVCLCWKVN